MADQLGANVTVDFKVESAYSTAPGASGATRLRFTDSPGMNTEMDQIKSGERRSDLLDTLARMGSRRSPGSYSAEMSLGAHDGIIEAAMRGTWTAPVVITQATAGLTSISTPTTSTIVASAGSWITAGVRVGDVVRLTNFATVANNNINLRIKTVTALTLTVHGTPLTVDASLDTTFTLTITKKLINPATPTRRTFYVEQRYTDAGASLIFPAARWIGLHITGAPDGMATLEMPILGGVPGQVVNGAAYYSSPTIPTGKPLTFADCTLAFDGTDIAKALGINHRRALRSRVRDEIPRRGTTRNARPARRARGRAKGFHRAQGIELHPHGRRRPAGRRFVHA
jgi:hypothetical protein